MSEKEAKKREEAMFVKNTVLINEIEKLKKENADLKCECRRCVYTDSPCVLSDYGKDKNGICDHFKDVFEELKNWKDEWQEQVQKATDEGYARTLQTIQLSKAKEIIKTLADDLSMYSGNYQKELLEAKQFLKDEPKSKWVNPVRTTNDNQIKLSEVKK